jgi:hypothetical protein
MEFALLRNWLCEFSKIFRYICGFDILQEEEEEEEEED